MLCCALTCRQVLVCACASAKQCSNFPNCSSIANELQEWELESTDHVKFACDSTASVNSNESLCAFQTHCNATGGMESSCDDCSLSATRLSKGYIKWFNFFSVAGLALFFATDMEESMVEERVIDCVLHSNCGSMKWRTSLGAQYVHFLIRGMHLLLPFFIAQAARSIFVSQVFFWNERATKHPFHCVSNWNGWLVCRICYAKKWLWRDECVF